MMRRICFVVILLALTVEAFAAVALFTFFYWPGSSVHPRPPLRPEPALIIVPLIGVPLLGLHATWNWRRSGSRQLSELK